MRIVDRLAETRRRERGEKTGGMKTEKISDGEGVTDREALVQSREHGLKCQLCAGETPGGEHTGSAAESHTRACSCKHICTSTHAGRLSSYVSRAALHLQTRSWTTYMVLTPLESGYRVRDANTMRQPFKHGTLLPASSHQRE